MGETAGLCQGECLQPFLGGVFERLVGGFLDFQSPANWREPQAQAGDDGGRGRVLMPMVCRGLRFPNPAAKILSPSFDRRLESLGFEARPQCRGIGHGLQGRRYRLPSPFVVVRQRLPKRPGIGRPSLPPAWVQPFIRVQRFRRQGSREAVPDQIPGAEADPISLVGLEKSRQTVEATILFFVEGAS